MSLTGMKARRILITIQFNLVLRKMEVIMK